MALNTGSAPVPNVSDPLSDADLDVLIIGAGISGIDAAYHLGKAQPGARYAILDSQDDIGGTWRTHRFPGIRSDSDLYTFGFRWKPWTGAPIATADEILAYLEAAIDENDLRHRLRFGHRVVQASWSQDTGRWSVTVLTSDPGTGSEQTRIMTCRFLWVCAGYYRHEAGYTPEWPGMAAFQGPIVHPQTWPEDLDYAGKRVVVVGSGATAATLVPALAEKAAHVTMLQRSPSYYYARPAVDEFEQTLRALDLPDSWVHDIMRRKYLHESRITVARSFAEPEALAADMVAGVRAYLGDGVDLEAHFTPRYRPWRQRVAVVPDGDLFAAIGSGKAAVVTDTIRRFTSTGLELDSGQTLQADIIVTATGLRLNALGDVRILLGDDPVDIAQCRTHRGIMLSGVPNLAMVFGYLRTSWTMRADLVSQYVCRLLDHMRDTGRSTVTPVLREQDQDMPARPWIDPEDFNAGYVMRGLDLMPKQGDRQPWVMTQDYFSDRETLPEADFEDGTLLYR